MPDPNKMKEVKKMLEDTMSKVDEILADYGADEDSEQEEPVMRGPGEDVPEPEYEPRAKTL